MSAQNPSSGAPAQQAIFWLFGRSAAGKTTLARELAARLRAAGTTIFELDGDLIRNGLSSDLGFDAAARNENHRRMAEVARIASNQGFVVVAASMAPRRSHRELLARILGNSLKLVLLDAPFEICRERDPKGLYHRSAAGVLSVPMTDDFETATSEEVALVVRTGEETKEQSSGRLCSWAIQTVQDQSSPSESSIPTGQ